MQNLCLFVIAQSSHNKMMLVLFVSLFALSLIHITNAAVYNVRSDNISLNNNDAQPGESLQYYLKNTSKYFSSNSQFHFKMGHHYLNTDLVIQNVTNVTLTGESLCIIRCTSHVNIIILNVANFRLENITFENCSTSYKNYLHKDFRFKHDLIAKPSSNASILLYHCESVEISNIAIIITEGNAGIIIVNVRNYSKIANIHITLQTNCPSVNISSLQTNGILIYYDNWNNPNKTFSEIRLDKFHFTTYGSCTHPIYYAITSLLFQNAANITVIIQNTIFTDLINVTALYYYGETCGIGVMNHLIVQNHTVSNNTGNPSLKMFHIVLYNIQCIDLFYLFESRQSNHQQYNNISFINCKFVNNYNMMSMIRVSPASSQATTGYLYLENNTFHSNRNTHFLIMKSTNDAESLWQLSNYVEISESTVTSNVHDEGQDLISIANSRVKIYGPLTIMHNRYYTNIMRFYLSSSSFQYDISICNNTVRQIVSFSFIFIAEYANINISRNTLYQLETHVDTYSINSEPICRLQYYSETKNFNLSALSMHGILSHNILTSTNFLFKRFDLKCRSLDGSLFQQIRIQPDFFFAKGIIEIENNTVISDNVYKRPIPLSICKCTDTKPGTSTEHDNIDCYSPHLSSIYPGQTLKVKLIVQKQWLYHNFPIPIVAKNTPLDDCTVVDISQLSQLQFNHDCNSYSYTLWPKDATVKMCKLYIGLPNMPEIFYVPFKTCPLGFTLQEDRKSCYCDPVLNKISIKSCNLSDETILRPAYSWIFAKKDNTNNITYTVSSQCPFDHCIPQQTDLNLSDPDSQCQFNRIGLLCGKCQQGLSSVFGSHKCKHCSNIHLLLIIPISIAGLALVAFLFIFDLTVRNGTINICIFYVNIININVLILFPNCHSFVCVILSFVNFDFRIASCFYNGMDDYAKEWIQLMLSFYLIIIAIVFIILSRYSATVQRFTAKKALPVLATLFLFSYTKVLVTVCNVLFRYSTVTHLPSNKIELVWSISTTTPLFGVKFLALFIVCIILFLILLPFNLILLFTRTLSRLKLIANFKPILDTYLGTYKDSAYYWTGLLLLIRAIVYALPSIDEDLSFLVISILLGGLLCLHAAVQPYKSKFCNIQECIAILNLLAVHAALLYKKNVVGQKMAMVLISIGVYYFIIAIVLHCCMYRWNNMIVKSIKCSLFMISKVKSICSKFVKVKSPQEDNSTEMLTFKSKIPDVAFPNFKEFQEPLLAIGPDK